MRSLIVLMTFLLVGCGNGYDRRGGPADYAGYEGFVNSFVHEGNIRGQTVDSSTLTIKKVSKFTANDAGENVVGMCYYGDNRIELLDTFWDNADYNYQEELIFHEMGHCLLKLKHSKTGLMGAYMMFESEWISGRKQFLDEVFYKTIAFDQD